MSAVVCPKCSHVRRPADKAPAWQCPSCGIAYVKWTGVQQLVVPPKAGEAAPPAAFDGSIWLLVAVNAAVLAIAHWQKWSLIQLMLAYWAQSIAIGVSYWLRIRSLDKFSTEGLKFMGEPLEERPESKYVVAAGFVLHFGFFNLMYLTFLFAGASMILKTPLRFDLWFWLCTAAFMLNHLWSYRYNRELDRQGTPNIGTMMFTPYIRVVPMHIMIASGAFVGAGGLLLWGVLKTGADVVMHLVEHAQLQKVKNAAKAAGTI